MQKLFVGAVIAALCAGPGLARAEAQQPARSVGAPASQEAQSRPGPDGTGAEDEAGEYAAREKAAPQLEEFKGGGDGVYIGTGALVLAVVIALLIVAL